MNGSGGRRVLRLLFEEALRGADPKRAVSEALSRPSVARTLSKAREIGVFSCGKAAVPMAEGVPGGLRKSALVVLPRGYPAGAMSSTEVFFSSHPEPDGASLAAARRALDFFAGFGPKDVLLSPHFRRDLLAPGPASARHHARVQAPGRAEAHEVGRLDRRDQPAAQVAVGRQRGKARQEDPRQARHARSLRRPGRPSLPGRVGSDDPGRCRRRDSGRRVQPVGARGGRAPRPRERAEPSLAARKAVGRGGASREGASRARPRGSSGVRSFLPAGRRPSRSGGPTAGAGGTSSSRSAPRSSSRAAEGITVLAAGSDGIDGSSRAAGALADGRTIARALRLGLDPERALAHHDTEPFFDRLGDLLVPGPTGTNVCDWAFALRSP